jgi:hypothetical protein
MARRAITEGLTAEQIREETQKFRVKTPRQPVPEPRLDGVRNLASGDAAQREGGVVRLLNECSYAVEEMERWIEARRWTRMATTEKQLVALAKLGERVWQLHQELAQINHNLDDTEEATEPLQRLEALRF